MRILLIDTCGPTGSVALAERDAIVAAETLPGRTASERLVATVKTLTERAGWTLASLDVAAVVHGPGSFTGVRVGLSAAKGLCEAVGAKMVAVSRLAVLAQLAGQTRACAVIDAGRGELYLGEYVDGKCLREGLVTRDEVLAAASEGVLVMFEPGVAALLAEAGPLLVREPLAEDALPLVRERIRGGRFDDAATIDANYLRRTDAQIFARPPAKPLPVAG